MQDATHKSQRAKILELLLRARGGWVPAYELGQIALQYGSRVLELRRLGFTIENKTETVKDGTRHGWFRLLPGVSGIRPPEAKADSLDVGRIQSPLFDMTPQERHRDDG